MRIPGELIPITFFICVAVTTIGVTFVRAWGRRLENPRRDRDESITPSDVAARLERMEQALDTIAIEIERISEGQRFTTKLLSERSDKKLGETPERS
jgi:hypothetical protein